MNSHLDASCTYTGGFDITASNVTLDCRGALLQHAGRDGSHAIAVSVDANANLENVTIRNCRIEGFAHGIDLVRIPRAPFVMVYAFALQDPAQPPVAPPPYTVPSLGVLPACP